MKRSKRTQTRSPKPPVKLVGIVSTGASQLLKVRGGYELYFYGSEKDAVELGMDRKLARRVFAKGGGNCPGACRRQLNPKGTHIWCVDINCAATARCHCHLISIWKNQDGDIEEEDHGTEHDKDDPHKKITGRVYVCRCM
jgi:hypothetical protein